MAGYTAHAYTKLIENIKGNDKLQVHGAGGENHKAV